MLKQLFCVLCLDFVLSLNVASAKCTSKICEGQGQVCLVKKNSEEVCQCIIQCLENGPYICASDSNIYKSRCHMDKRACELNVIIFEHPCSNPKINELSHCPDLQQIKKPVQPIVMGLEYQLFLHQGRNGEIHCNVEGNPSPTINWLRNGLPIDIAHNPHYSTDGNKLYLKNGISEMEGNYTCVAINCVNDFKIFPPVNLYSQVLYLPDSVSTFEENCIEKLWVANNKSCSNQTKVMDFWSYNAKSGKCESRQELTCKAGNNMFNSKTECIEKCMTYCNSDINEGPCHHKFVMVSFDNNAEACQLVTYGGCEGSGNMFYSKKDCNQVCAKRYQLLTPYRKQSSKTRRCAQRCNYSVKRAYCQFDFLIRAHIVSFRLTSILVKLIRPFKSLPTFPLKRMNQKNPGKLLQIQLRTDCRCPRLNAARQRHSRGNSDFIISGDFFGTSMILRHLRHTTASNLRKVSRLKSRYCPQKSGKFKASKSKKGRRKMRKKQF